MLLPVALADALKLTADAPATWIEAAVLIPSTLGDLAAIERVASDPEFRARFQIDPTSAVTAAGLTPTAPLLTALRDHLSR